MKNAPIAAIVSVLVSVLLLGACGGVEPEPTVGATRSALSTTNGSNLNGSNLNGSNLNGTELAGTLAKLSLAGIEVGGHVLDSASVKKSQLSGTRGGVSYSGADFVGATLSGEAADGTPVSLMIDGVTAPASSGGPWKYHVLFSNADGGWSPVCNDSAWAVAVNGRWDYRQGVPGGGAKIADSSAFTLGCDGAAVSKCINIGYRPWVSPAHDALHQTCVRMIRADYCGDGVSHTTNGRRINVFDAFGIQVDDQPWVQEAEWDPDGARCIALLNRDLLGALCNNDLIYTLSCGNRWHFLTGTLVMTETPSGPLDAGGILGL